MSPSKASSPSKKAREAFMSRAIELARQGKGKTAPNPCVGAVLVRGDRIVAEGRHNVYGGPHAERECLWDAAGRGVDPSKCTLYVTLEPCNHYGKTPPCTEAILAAKVPRVVVGARDPNPDVAGGGIEILRQHGVEVQVGALQDECLALIDDFLLWKATSRTYNTLKLAVTLDGKIAARSRAPEAVSSPESIDRVQMMRASTHAVLVGGGTFRSDNPSLDCRLEELPDDFNQPYAVVVTTDLPAPDDDCTLLTRRAMQTIFWTTREEAASEKGQALGRRVTVWGLPKARGGVDLAKGFERLRAELACHYVLVEGGGRLAMSLVDQDLVDELVLFLAPKVLGDDKAVSAFAGGKPVGMAEAVGFDLMDACRVGPDLQITYKPVREK